MMGVPPPYTVSSAPTLSDNYIPPPHPPPSYNIGPLIPTLPQPQIMYSGGQAMPGTMQTMQPVQPVMNVTTQHQPAAPFELNPSQASSFIGMGATNIVLGCLCILFNVIYNFIGGFPFMQEVSPGIWIGALCVFTGVIGVISGKKHKQQGWIIGFLILSIINTLIVWVLLGFASTAVALERIYVYCPYNSYSSCDRTKGAIAMGALLIICALVEFGIAIASAVICCGPVCCNTPKQNTVQYISTTPGQQTLVLQPGQKIVYPPTQSNMQA